MIRANCLITVDRTDRSVQVVPQQLAEVRWIELEGTTPVMERNCLVCWVVYRKIQRQHPQLDCPEHDEKDVEAIHADLVLWQRVIRWQPWAACFVCGFPWGLCPRFAATGHGRCRVVGGRRCRAFQPQIGRCPAMILLWSLTWRYGPMGDREWLRQ